MPKFSIKWSLTYLLLFLIVSVSASAQSSLLNVQQHGAQQVVLKLDHGAPYEVYQLDNPPRLFVYIQGSDIKTDRMELKGKGKYIQRAKIHPFEGNFGTVRVQIDIAKGMEYKDWTSKNQIHIWVGKPSQSPPPTPSEPEKAEASGKEEKQPPKQPSPTPQPSKTGEYPKKHAPPRLLKPPEKIRGRTVMLATNYVDRPGSDSRAKKLLDIVVTAGDQATEVVINTDGPVRTFDDFLLISPKRMVVDIFDVKADYIKPQLHVDSSAVKDIRWGPHRDKIRVVADLAPNVPKNVYYRVQKLSSGIKVIIYPTLTIEQAPPSDFKVHDVQSGENLREIALKYYGDSRPWRRIVSYNRDKLADPEAILSSNGLLYPSSKTRLRIPVR